MIKLSVTDCEYKNCPELVKQLKFYGKKNSKGFLVGTVRRVCGLTGKIPGNMPKCPKEVK